MQRAADGVVPAAESEGRGVGQLQPAWQVTACRIHSARAAPTMVVWMVARELSAGRQEVDFAGVAHAPKGASARRPRKRWVR